MEDVDYHYCVGQKEQQTERRKVATKSGRRWYSSLLFWTLVVLSLNFPTLRGSCLPRAARSCQSSTLCQANSEPSLSAPASAHRTHSRLHLQPGRFRPFDFCCPTRQLLLSTKHCNPRPLATICKSVPFTYVARPLERVITALQVFEGSV